VKSAPDQLLKLKPRHRQIGGFILKHRGSNELALHVGNPGINHQGDPLGSLDLRRRWRGAATGKEQNEHPNDQGQDGWQVLRGEQTFSHGR
jgi:hypothetical protein